MRLYSYSKIKCFQQCPLSFRYQYVDKIEVPYFETIEAFMGSRVHEALDIFYNSLKTKKDLSLEDLLSAYNEIWAKEIRPDVLVNKEGLTHEDYRLKGGRCLTDYFIHHQPFDETEVISTEMRIDIDLASDGRYRLMGYIDRLDRHPSGRYEIHDYKTSSRLPDPKKNGFDEQLALYEIGVRQKMGEVKDVDLVWHFLLHDRDIRVRKNACELDVLSRRFLESIQDIECAIALEDFPKKESKLCGWCAYQGICERERRNRKITQKTLSSYFEDG